MRVALRKRAAGGDEERAGKPERAEGERGADRPG